MKLLIIECSESPMSIAVQNEEVTVESFGSEWTKSSERIIPHIRETLTNAALTAADLDAVAISAGPGSFTALRIAISTAKGICFALNKPLILIPTLQALAQSVQSHSNSKLIVPIITSKAHEFYVGILNRESHHFETIYLTFDELVSRFSGQDATLVGRNLSKWKSLFQESNLKVIDANFFSARSLVPLSQEKFLKKEFADLHTSEPLYMKEFEVKMKK